MDSNKKVKVDILILNYNGKDLLMSFLSSVCKAAKKSFHKCKVYVVDNVSTDGSVEYVKNNFPTVKLYLSKKNEVLCSYNEVLKVIDSDVVILLNNDIKVEEDFADYLIEHFKDENVFFVAPRLLNFDGTYNGGRSYLKIKYGMLKNIVDETNATVPGETHSIATGAFRRDLFLRLGGFDSLYLPGICEEVDLCYRALVSGKKGVYEPKSIIWHKESTTFNREYGKRRKMVIAHRNVFLFFWKNIHDKRLIAEHLFLLPFRVAHSIVFGNVELAQGFWLALLRLPAALSRRYQCIPQLRLRVLKDSDIIR